MRWRWSRLRSRLSAIAPPRKSIPGFWPCDPQFESHGNYPPGCKVEQANQTTIRFARSLNRALDIAEIGVYHGHTSREFARLVAENGGSLHLFDFEDRVLHVRDLLRCDGHHFAIPHPNSRKTHDSYNWSLKRLLAESDQPRFDYIFLDGAHTWAHDALAFLLADRLLRPGGHIDFDDHDWSLAISPTLNPSVFPRTAADFTPEQIAERQVESILNLLVRRDPRYTEIVPNKIFRKE
jgi:predicted O-methyltransferase YrrM